MKSRLKKILSAFAALLLTLQAPLSVGALQCDGSAACRLPQTADAGEDYLASLYFFGESTTAHLCRTGGVMENDPHVLRDATGTRMLDARTARSPVEIQTDKGSIPLPLCEALEVLRPSVLVLSFGLNGVVSFSKNTDRYVSLYRALIGEILQASPTTRIILQTVYPVCRADRFSVDVCTLNAYIRVLNNSLDAVAADFENVRIADTASILCAPDGSLEECYHVGDGIHLSNQAYQKILLYLRTHAWL